MQLVTFSWSQSPLTIRILPMEDFPGGSDGKASVYNAGDLGLIPEDPRKETATHSSTLAWKIPWTEEPGRLQSMGSLRVGHGWATSLQTSYALSVLYKWNNNKAWKTQAHLFTTWFPEYFRPTVYCPGKKKKIPLKISVLTDKTTGHPRTLTDIYKETYYFYTCQYNIHSAACGSRNHFYFQVLFIIQ